MASPVSVVVDCPSHCYHSFPTTRIVPDHGIAGYVAHCHSRPSRLSGAVWGDLQEVCPSPTPGRQRGFVSRRHFLCLCVLNDLRYRVDGIYSVRWTDDVSETLIDGGLRTRTLFFFLDRFVRYLSGPTGHGLDSGKHFGDRTSEVSGESNWREENCNKYDAVGRSRWVGAGPGFSFGNDTSWSATSACLFRGAPTIRAVSTLWLEPCKPGRQLFRQGRWGNSPQRLLLWRMSHIQTRPRFWLAGSPAPFYASILFHSPNWPAWRPWTETAKLSLALSHVLSRSTTNGVAVCVAETLIPVSILIIKAIYLRNIWCGLEEM